MLIRQWNCPLVTFWLLVSIQIDASTLSHFVNKSTRRRNTKCRNVQRRSFMQLPHLWPRGYFNSDKNHASPHHHYSTVAAATSISVLPPLIATGVIINVVKVLTSEPARRAFKFWIHAGPIVVHYRWTQFWLDLTSTSKSNEDRSKQVRLREHRDKVYHNLHERYSEKALHLVLQLRGLYVKIGQIMSSRPDFMPAQYIQHFATLQDAIPQWPVENVEQIMRESLLKDIGIKYDDLIESLDPVALGSASIGQVHRAVLKVPATSKTTALVTAVKVMHPGAQQTFKHDFQVFRWLCRVALPGWRGLLDEIEKRIMTEFDYRNEAKSLSETRENVLRSPFRTKVCIPEPYLSSQHVLIMEMLNGKKLVDAIKDGLSNALDGDKDLVRDLLKAREQAVLHGETEDQVTAGLVASLNFRKKLKLLALMKKYKRYIDLLLDVHGFQIFRSGCFNADPHFGNCLELDDGRLGLIDYGQTKRLNDHERTSFAKIVAALDNGDAPQTIARCMTDAGFSVRDSGDNETIVKYAKLFFDSDVESRMQGFATPQLYFASLMMKNPLIDIPDAAIFVARCSFIFRGAGTALGLGQLQTAKHWAKYAKEAIQ